MHNVKYICVGPGGVKCHCCFPPPGSAARRALHRRAKRKEKLEALRVEQDNAESYPQNDAT